MNQQSDCCGVDCEKCGGGIATLNNDNTLYEKTAMGITLLGIL